MNRFETRLDRIAEALEPPGGDDPGYRVVVELPDGTRHLATPNLPTIQLPGDDRERYRPFRPGLDDRDSHGRPLRVERIDADSLNFTVRYTPNGPRLVANRDTFETRRLCRA